MVFGNVIFQTRLSADCSHHRTSSVIIKLHSLKNVLLLFKFPWQLSSKDSLFLQSLNCAPPISQGLMEDFFKFQYNKICEMTKFVKMISGTSVCRNMLTLFTIMF